MTTEQIEDIFEDAESSWECDNVFQGIEILRKYFDPSKETLFGGADHDIIYFVGVDDLIEKNVTREDLEKLAKLNWMIEEDSLACFV